MPRATIIIPAYRAERTLKSCLEAIQHQSFHDFDVVVIDSSPTQTTQALMKRSFPQVLYVPVEKRMLPDQASNLGVELTSGELLVFTDADAYPRQDWLEKLMAAFERLGSPTAGSVACYGRKWFDLGAHLCKFDKWLPDGRERSLKEAPTINLLIPRGLYEQMGPFSTSHIHADTEFCWRLGEAGIEIWLEPAAVVEHHHLHSWISLLQERFVRGKAFKEFLMHWRPRSRWKLLWLILISVVPARLLSQLARVAGNAVKAKMVFSFIVALPVVITGLYAWLLGEASGYLEHLLSHE